MNEDYTLLKKRFIELAKKSYGSDIFTFTDFLGLAEQSAFAEVKNQLGGVRYSTFGGALHSERVIVRFGDVEELGYEVPYPIVTLRVAPKEQKFADALTHRDFLGSILALGIDRSRVGDIVIRDNVGYVFVHEDIAEYIISSLSKVRRTDVTVCVTDSLPEGELYRTETRKIQLSSERLDAVVAKVFSLSREAAQSLFHKGLVFVGGKCTESASYTPREGDVISVRGYGRMIYRGFDSLSRKGKLNAVIELYI